MEAARTSEATNRVGPRRARMGAVSTSDLLSISRRRPEPGGESEAAATCRSAAARGAPDPHPRSSGPCERCRYPDSSLAPSSRAFPALRASDPSATGGCGLQARPASDSQWRDRAGFAPASPRALASLNCPPQASAPCAQLSRRRTRLERGARLQRVTLSQDNLERTFDWFEGALARDATLSREFAESRRSYFAHRAGGVELDALAHRRHLEW